ncbi:MAG: hypothetical protein K9L30_03405 [Desulfobacterales bacterium]|nr:hypothetical protein [Desulfobacterales bacterium]
MSILPEGEDIRRAVKWISENREAKTETPISQLIEEACQKFDLSPLDANFLSRTVLEEETNG